MRKNKKQVDKPAANSDRERYVWWKYAVSLLLIVHLAAVFLPPFTHATSVQRSVPVSVNKELPGGAGGGGAAVEMVTVRSPLAVSLRNSLLGKYIEAAFLDHGYAFFAPDPPRANYLIRYRLEFDDGRPPLERTFPDLQRHWPRLLYHRHFMLTSQINDEISLAPQVAKRKWESFKRHLKSKFGASHVKLTLVEHFVPTPNDFEDGMSIRDPRLHRDLVVPFLEPEAAEELR